MRQIKRIILFRFHDHFDVCGNHLAVLKKFNPHIEIYGLYGGVQRNFPKARKLRLKHVWNIPIDDPHWKWVNGDLCIRWWFKDFGKNLKFDVLHVFEWDLILLENIEKRFAHIKNGVAVTGIKPMARISDTGLRTKFFNADGEVSPSVLYKNRWRVKSFHPVKNKLNLNFLV